MKKLFVFGLFLLLTFPNIFASKLDEVRNQFPYFKSFEEVDLLLKSIEKDPSDLATAYKGALYMFKSKFADSKLDKYKYFKKGKSLIDTSCEKNPYSLEIRYIRIIFQHQLPTFLGYNDHKIKDFDFFISQFPKSTLTIDFKKKMVNNLEQLDKLTTIQKKQLNNLL